MSKSKKIEPLLHERLQAFKDKHELSVARLVEEIGVGKTTIANLLAAKGVSTATRDAVTSYLDEQETPSESALTMCNKCDARPMLPGQEHSNMPGYCLSCLSATTLDSIDENAAADRIERLRLAKEECAAEKAWHAAGSKGKKPATPNLDVVRAEYANPGSTKTTRRKSTSTRPPARPDAELRSRLVELFAETPTLTMTAASKVLNAEGFRMRAIRLAYKSAVAERPQSTTKPKASKTTKTAPATKARKSARKVA